MTVAIARGKCGNCEQTVIYLEWIDGKRVLTVECPDCNESNHYDLSEMISALGPNMDIYEQILERFQPHGRPN